MLAGVLAVYCGVIPVEDASMLWFWICDGAGDGSCKEEIGVHEDGGVYLMPRHGDVGLG